MKTDTATKSDLEALTELKRDYIHSVQHGDVQRFDKILARLGFVQALGSRLT